MESEEIPPRVLANTLLPANISLSDTLDNSIELKPEIRQITVGQPDPTAIVPAAASAVNMGNINISGIRDTTEKVEVSGRLAEGVTHSYQVWLEEEDKLTVALLPPPNSVYTVYFENGSSTHFPRGFENGYGVCEFVAPSDGTYTISVVARAGHANASEDYKLELYYRSKHFHDAVEPNHCYQNATTLEGILGGNHTSSRYTMFSTIDNPFDLDYFSIPNIVSGDKITVNLDLYGDYIDNMDQFEFELWRIVSSNYVDEDGIDWWDYTYEVLSIDNKVAQSIYSQDASMVTKSFSYIAPKTENASDTYYVVVKTKNDPPNQFTGGYFDMYDGNTKGLISATKISRNVYDSYENAASKTIPNDYIKVNDRVLAQDFPGESVSANLDSALDIDWYRVKGTGEQTVFHFTDGSRADDYYKIALFDANCNPILAGRRVSYRLDEGADYFVGAYMEWGSWASSEAERRYTLHKEQNNALEITGNLLYNNGEGARVGLQNSLSFTAKSKYATEKTYEARITVNGYAKPRTWVTLKGGYAEQTVTISDVALYNKSDTDVDTTVELYDGGTLLAVLSTSGPIADMGGKLEPQEVIFEQPTQKAVTVKDSNGNDVEMVLPHYLIFDDQPEHIRRCDLLDDGTYEPRALMHAENLGPGVYQVFSYHHKSNGFLARAGTVLDRNQPIYFDAAFYNSPGKYGDVQVTRLGYSSNGRDGGDTWLNLFNAWTEYTNGTPVIINYNNYTNISIDKTKWLRDVLWEMYPGDDSRNSTRISSGAEMGYSMLMMEFVVTSGSVNFATVAYKNEQQGHAVFDDWNQTGSIKSVNEPLLTVNGVGETTSQVIGKEMEYVIDDTVGTETRLPVSISNRLFANRKSSFFTTHMTEMSANNRWTVPGSSVVELTYHAEGVARTSSTGAEESYGVRDWKFDGMHPADFAKAKGKYGDLIDEDYKYDEAWIKSLAEPDDYLLHQEGDEGTLASREETFVGFQSVDVVHSYWDEASQTFVERAEVTEGMTPINTGYGLTYEYTVKVYNAGEQTKTFSYIFEGMDYHIDWSVNGGARQGKDIRQRAENGFADIIDYDENNDPIYDEKCWPEEVFCIELPPGETTIKIWVEIMTGSNPSCQNAFVINADDSKRKRAESEPEEGSDERYYYGTRYDMEMGDRWDIISYPFI